MNAAIVKISLNAATDKRTWKIVGSVFVIVLLLVTAVGTSCTAHNLQSYAIGQVASGFAPLVSSVNSTVEEGELNIPLLYAAYITVFDNQQYPDKPSVQSKLIRCFYSQKTKKSL